MSAEASPARAPVAIGGVGGSGTRLIAAILRRLDYYMGDDLNEANDNLWFTLLFKRAELWGPSTQAEFERAVRVFRAVMVTGEPLTGDDEFWVESLAETDRPQQPAAWLRERAESLRRAARRRGPRPGAWGWKEPNTHVFLDRLQGAFPGMMYIHVMRNGLDMAYSANQDQFRLWGRFFLGDDRFESTPRWSLKYWCAVHRRVMELGQRMPGRFLLLNYDAFCAAPREGARELIGFLGAPVDAGTESSLISLVKSPESIGRHRQHDLDAFDAGDVAYVQELGFDCGTQRLAAGGAG